jgi:hypothetical protein
LRFRTRLFSRVFWRGLDRRKLWYCFHERSGCYRYHWSFRPSLSLERNMLLPSYFLFPTWNAGYCTRNSLSDSFSLYPRCALLL